MLSVYPGHIFFTYSFIFWRICGTFPESGFFINKKKSDPDPCTTVYLDEVGQADLGEGQWSRVRLDGRGMEDLQAPQPSVTQHLTPTKESASKDICTHFLNATGDEVRKLLRAFTFFA